ALSTIDEAIDWSERTEELWCLAELLRVKAEVLRLAHSDSAAVEQMFQRSLSIAGQQGALSYELRIALDAAHFWRDSGRGRQAQVLLDSITRRLHGRVRHQRFQGSA